MRGLNRQSGGFSLIELMVSVSVLAILMAIIYGIIDQVSRSWSSAGSKVAQFKEARAASEAITLRLSQATLNTYWGYDDPSLPSRYLPQSELHFVCGKAEDLRPAGDSGKNPTHAVFFLAPLGFTSDDDIRPFTGLLNACGFYIEYASDADFRPGTMSAGGAEERWRFRLMEYRQPSEALRIYDHANLSEEDRFDRWREDLGEDTNRPLAENIIALVFAPMSSREEAAAGGVNPYAIAPNYEFDSRVGDPEKRHQLPPVIRIVMVAIDEGSAMRLEFGSAPPVLFPSDLFESINNEEELRADVAALEQSLVDQRISFRSFHSVVPLRAAKWSSGL